MESNTEKIGGIEIESLCNVHIYPSEEERKLFISPEVKNKSLIYLSSISFFSKFKINRLKNMSQKKKKLS